MHPPADLVAMNSTIADTVLERSAHIRKPNFTTISTADLRLLVDLYDTTFFGGVLAQMLREDEAGRLGLRLSNRMTRIGGHCSRRRHRVMGPQGPVERTTYEVAISSLLLFQTFRKEGETTTVNGLDCRNRLEALQRVLEHELLHLAELLAWGQSDCKATRLRSLARRIFGHTDVVHQLMTSRKLADQAYALRVGDRVRFVFQGTAHTGRINRITRRATILVEDPRGQPFRDGCRYLTYYVPLDQLGKVEAS
jgi:hypothetical protein